MFVQPEADANEIQVPPYCGLGLLFGSGPSSDSEQAIDYANQSVSAWFGHSYYGEEYYSQSHLWSIWNPQPGPGSIGGNGPWTIAVAALPGDANSDGKVDINDLTIVLARYNQTGMTWSQGEFNGDGSVDINDLSIVLANYNATSGIGPAAVPEPSCLVLLGIGAFALLLIRRRGRS